MNKLFAVFIAVVLIFAGYTLVKNYQNNNQILENVIKVVPDSISIADQKLFSDNVIIENRVSATAVSLSWPGFVAIYKNPYDKYGTLIGTSRFLTAGEHKNVPIDLIESYPAGMKLYAVLHKDTGDAIYNLVQDLAVKDKQGREVMASFVVKGE